MFLCEKSYKARKNKTCKHGQDEKIQYEKKYNSEKIRCKNAYKENYLESSKTALNVCFLIIYVHTVHNNVHYCSYSCPVLGYKRTKFFSLKNVVFI
jgi:hypothetical protein